jgi:hypothetical protein
LDFSSGGNKVDQIKAQWNVGIVDWVIEGIEKTIRAGKAAGD